MRRFLCPFIILCLFFSYPGNIFSQDATENQGMPISAEDARLIAISNNLEVKLAQLDSKIKGTELSYREAVFDTSLNGEIKYTDNQKKKASSLSGTKSLTNNYNIGVEKKLRSGTDLALDFTNKREWTDSSYVSTNPYHESQLEMTITQPIAKNFFGLIDRGDIEIVRWEIRNAELDSYIKIEDAIISAEKAYWKLVLAREEFKIKKEMLKKSIILFNQHRRKLHMGLVETGDVLAAEANMHLRESELMLSSNDLKTAEENLRLQLNLTNTLRLIPTDELFTTHFDADLLDSMEIAFEKRRDYASRKNEIENKKINLEMKSNSRLPEIDLTATLANNGISAKYYRAISDIFEDSNPAYSIGIEFSFQLENNEANSEYEKAALEKTKAIVKLQKTERQIISDVDEAFRKLSVNKTNIAKMERVENLQRSKLFQEEKRFKYGRSNSDRLIRYQEDLLKASLVTQETYYDYRISILDLAAAEDSFLERAGLE